MGLDFKDDIQPMLKPLMIAAVAFVIGFTLFNLEIGEEDSSGRITAMIIGGVFFAVGGGFLIWPVGKLLVSAFEMIFWPQDAYKAPPNFKLPEWYCQQGRYGDALEEYEKIVSNYPQELDGWVGILNVTVYYMGNVPGGAALLERARKALKDPQSLQAIEEHYTALSAGGHQPAEGEVEEAYPEAGDDDPNLPPG